MIFAHGPAGFTITYLTRKYWSEKLTQTQIYWIYFFGILGGLFPDVDLFYYYFSSATKSHREMITHSFFIYLVIFFIILSLTYLLKNNFFKQVTYIFFLGILTHLITDSVGAGLMWLYPFSSYLYGLASIDYLGNIFLPKYFFAVNYSLEALFFVLFFFIIIKNIVKNKKAKKIIIAVMLIFFILFLWVLLFVNNHLFVGKGNFYYTDFDQDGLINSRDQDIDNDGILNIDDQDIDNDGKSNSVEMNDLVSNNENVWYDISEGGFIEIPLRMGLVTNADLINRLFENVGIFLRSTMSSENIDYFSSSESKDFDRQPKNWQLFLAHQNKLLSDDEEIRNYDILFFANDYVALAVDNGYALTADPDRKKVFKIKLSDLIEEKGSILKIGRLLP